MYYRLHYWYDIAQVTNIIIFVIYNSKTCCLFYFVVSVGAGIERLMIQNSEGASEDDSMELLDFVRNQHGDHLPSETIQQIYNASAEEIR